MNHDPNPTVMNSDHRITMRNSQDKFEAEVDLEMAIAPSGYWKKAVSSSS